MTPKVKSSTLTAMKCLLTLLLLVSSSTVLSASDANRVEVIVFKHLQAIPESKEATELRSFSRFPDLEEKKPDENPPDSAVASRTTPSPGDVLTGEL